MSQIDISLSVFDKQDDQERLCNASIFSFLNDGNEVKFLANKIYQYLMNGKCIVIVPTTHLSHLIKIVGDRIEVCTRQNHPSQGQAVRNCGGKITDKSRALTLSKGREVDLIEHFLETDLFLLV